MTDIVDRLKEGVFGSDEAKTDDVLHCYMKMGASEIRSLRDELREQCRLNGMGSEREAALLSKVSRLEHQVAILEHTIEAARVAMTAAPMWHEQHRAAWDALKKLEAMK